jgi:inorganic pyrophosphatase
LQLAIAYRFFFGRIVNKKKRFNAVEVNSGIVNVIIDTPKGSRNKYKFDEDLKMFKLRKVLPAGAVFPFNFGYIPFTKGGDGDPLDVLVLMDEPAFPGCLITTRLIGVIEAEQTEKDGKTGRNDRLLGISEEAHTNKGLRSIGKLNQTLVNEIEHFFIGYNEMEGKKFKPVKRSGPIRALRIVEEGIKNFKKG